MSGRNTGISWRKWISWRNFPLFLPEKKAVDQGENTLFFFTCTVVAGGTTINWSCYTRYREAWLTWMQIKFAQVIGILEAPTDYINLRQQAKFTATLSTLTHSKLESSANIHHRCTNYRGVPCRRRLCGGGTLITLILPILYIVLNCK